MTWFARLACVVMCVRPLQTVVLLCTLLGSVQRRAVQCLYLKARMSGSKRQSRGDVAGTTVLIEVLNHKMKNASIFCVFSCIICVKSITNLRQYSAL